MTLQTSDKYAHLFVDGDDQYPFVKNLGNGGQSYAQLVWHLQSGELRVRKVSVERLSLFEKEEDDTEQDILTKLQERARQAGVQPNIVHLFSGGHFPARQVRPGDPQKWHRVAYTPYMNGGHLDDFLSGCRERGLAVSRSLVLRLVHQIASALHFMYAKPAVLQRDLHLANIFLHWVEGNELPEFYVGDLGRAIQADDEGFKTWDVHAQTLFEGGFQPYEEDVQSLLSHARALLACPTGRSQGGKVAEPDIVKQVMAKLDEIANPPMTPGTPPDLTGLPGLLLDAPTLPNDLEDLSVFRFGLQDTNGATPLYHDTLDECLQVRQIHGPWHISKASPSDDSANLLPVIIEISDRTYHRPNELNGDSDTDPGELPGNIKVFE